MLHKTIYKNENFEWVDIQDLKVEDIPSLSKEYKINTLHLKDCINTNHLPKAEDLGDTKFILTRMSYDTNRNTLNSINDISTKIGIFVRENFILTIHRVENEVINKIVEDINKEIIKKPTSSKIALELALGILKSFRKKNLVLLERVEKLENEVFTKQDSSSVEIKKIYRFRRRASLTLRLLTLSGEWVQFYDKLPIEKIEFNDLKDTYIEVSNSFEYLNSQSANLISLFLALSDQKNNESMKILAVYSAYFLPITFLASLYGMNFSEMIGINHRYGFYIMLGIMVVIVIVTSFFMKRKKVK